MVSNSLLPVSAPKSFHDQVIFGKAEQCLPDNSDNVREKPSTSLVKPRSIQNQVLEQPGYHADTPIESRMAKSTKGWVEVVAVLDDTPLLDINPYVPMFDCFEARRVGWLEGKSNQPVTANSPFEVREPSLKRC